MALGPAEVHPQEHLGPVGGLGAAGAGADRQERGASVVLAREEELRPLAREVDVQRLVAAVELGLELAIVGFGKKVDERLELPRAGLEAAPRLELGAQAVSLAEDLLGFAPVLPE